MAAAAAKRNHQSIPVTPDQPAGADEQSTAAAPWEVAERLMNRFIRTVALLERLGNGLGTLAFTWATVVILGGFSTDLGQDFWYATTIAFLEAFRVFSRENRSDDELLFKTTGSIRLKRVKLISNVPYYLNVGIVMVSLYGTLEFLIRHHKYLSPPPAPHELQYHILLLAVLLASASMVQLPAIVKYMNQGHPLLQSSPLVAVLALGGVLLWTKAPLRYAALVVAPLFVGCLQYSLVESFLQRTNVLDLAKAKLPIWLQKVGALIFPVWIAISVPIAFGHMGVLVLLGTLLVGNIQIPVALARIALSSMRLSNKGGHNSDNQHLAPALKIFYSMVLGQGALYVLACMCESLLFPYLRRSLAEALSVVPASKKVFQSVDQYYEHAYDKCMHDGVLAQEDLKLVRFGVDSLKSNSRTKKLAAVQILHSLVLRRQEAPSTKTLLVSEITTSTRAVATLISMLGWTAPEDQEIRLFAAKVTAELAGDLLIAGIPGTMQMVSSLLDLDAKNNSVKRSIISAQELNTTKRHTDNLQRSHSSTARVDIKGEEAGHQRPTVQANSAHAVWNSEWSCKLWQHIKSIFSAPEEGNEPWTEEDFLPIQGMIILEKLTHNLDNCAEINRATGLIPKIIGFMSYNTGTENLNEVVHQKLYITSSLKLVAKLVNTKGGADLALRRKISEQPYLLSNLAEILEDRRSQMDQLKLAMDILSKLAVDDETSHEIGSFQLFIPILVRTFLGQDESRNNISLRMVAVEALAVLSTENSANCSSILQENINGFFYDLEKTLDDFGYFAATLLQNLCAHSRDMLQHLGSNEHLSSALRTVLGKIMNAEGKLLESLIGLASQMHNVIPERFVDELSDINNGTRLVKKLMGTFTCNRRPSHEYPRMRRVTIEMAITVLESCPCYANIFKEQGMMEALTKVESTPSKVEKYKVFFGDTGIIQERGLPLGDLVARAKGLIDSAPTSDAHL